METAEEIHQAFCADNAARIRELLAQNPAFKARINEPIGPFDSPAIINVRSSPMLDVLLDAGADINAKSRWWAGGFGLLDLAGDELARHAIERGAVVEAHAAARLGLMDRLRELVEKDRSVVNARGGDGKRPLHFARTVQIAGYLLDHGAEIDALDVDHESTPAQHLIAERPDVVRFLVQKGCRTDIFLAAALGDAALARKQMQLNPGCVSLRVNDECFPKANPRAGGTIYLWNLGRNFSPHQVARKFGHEVICKLLLEHSPSSVRLINCLQLGDESEATKLLVANPGLVSQLSNNDLRAVTDAATDNDTGTVSRMLAAGFPNDVLGQHGATPLHWAAWHGNAGMVEAILKTNPPLEAADREFKATPLGWARHGSANGWHRATGNYAAVEAMLLAKGAKPLPAAH